MSKKNPYNVVRKTIQLNNADWNSMNNDIPSLKEELGDVDLSGVKRISPKLIKSLMEEHSANHAYVNSYSYKTYNRYTVYKLVDGELIRHKIFYMSV